MLRHLVRAGPEGAGPEALQRPPDLRAADLPRTVPQAVREGGVTSREEMLEANRRPLHDADGRPWVPRPLVRRCAVASCRRQFEPTPASPKRCGDCAAERFRDTSHPGGSE